MLEGRTSEAEGQRGGEAFRSEGRPEGGGKAKALLLAPMRSSTEAVGLGTVGAAGVSRGTWRSMLVRWVGSGTGKTERTELRKPLRSPLPLAP